MRRLRWVAGLVVVLALTGCGPRTTLAGSGAPASATPTSATPTSPGASAAPSPSPPAGTVAKPAAPPSRATTAPTTAFAVGVRQLSLSRGDRPLRTVVWYPASGSAGAGAKANATPAAGTFPLVLFSHGLTSSPEGYQALTIRFAAAGFVVAAPAYPFTSSDATTFNANDIVNQPADATYVITQVLKLSSTSGDPLAGHIDATRIAAGGHSAGGYTTVGMLSGSGRDARLRAGIVLSGGSLGGAFSGAATPVLFVHGDADDTVPYSTGRAVYSRLTWPKAFLTLAGGNHISPVFGSGAATTASGKVMLDFLRYTLYGDAAAKSRLAGDAAAGSSTTWESTL